MAIILERPGPRLNTRCIDATTQQTVNNLFQDQPRSIDAADAVGRVPRGVRAFRHALRLSGAGPHVFIGRVVPPGSQRTNDAEKPTG